MQTIFARGIAIEVLQTIYLKADIAVETFAKEYIAEEVIAIKSFAKEYIAIKKLQSNFARDIAIDVCSRFLRFSFRSDPKNFKS